MDGRNSVIAIFACRRPKLLKDLIVSLQANREAKESDLIIFVGGARNKRDSQLVLDTIKVAKSVTGFKTVQVQKCLNILGAGELISYGIEKTLKERDRLIVLEDDLVVRKDFLLYMNTALERYKDDPKVSQVSGWNFGIMKNGNPEKTYLLQNTTSWGWGTWRRAWLYPTDVRSDFKILTESYHRIRKFNYGDNYNLLPLLERVIESNFDAYDVQFSLYNHIRGMLTLYPNSSLIINQGFNDGSNFKNKHWKSEFEERPVSQFSFPKKTVVSMHQEKYNRLVRRWVLTFWPTSKLRFSFAKQKRKFVYFKKYGSWRFFLTR